MVRKTSIAILATALAAAGATAAFATPSSDNDAQTIQKSRVTLTQAISAAEQQAGGKAARAEFEHSKQHGWVYDVEVVNGPKVFEIKVDAQKGTVIASREDSADRDDDKDERD